MKFMYTNVELNLPHHLSYVATLPCKCNQRIMHHVYDIPNDLGISYRSDVVLGSKGQRSRPQGPSLKLNAMRSFVFDLT